MSANSHVAGLPMLACTSMPATFRPHQCHQDIACESAKTRVMCRCSIRPHPSSPPRHHLARSCKTRPIKCATEEVIEAMFPPIELPLKQTGGILLASASRRKSLIQRHRRRRRSAHLPSRRRSLRKDLRCHEKAVFATFTGMPRQKVCQYAFACLFREGQRDRVETLCRTMAWLRDKAYIKTYEENGSVKKIEVTDKPFFYKGMNMSLAADDRDFELSGSARETMRYMASIPLRKPIMVITCGAVPSSRESDLRRHTSAAVCTLPPASW